MSVGPCLSTLVHVSRSKYCSTQALSTKLWHGKGHTFCWVKLAKCVFGKKELFSMMLEYFMKCCSLSEFGKSEGDSCWTVKEDGAEMCPMQVYATIIWFVGICWSYMCYKSGLEPGSPGISHSCTPASMPYILFIYHEHIWKSWIIVVIVVVIVIIILFLFL